MSGEREALEQIHEKAENALAAASLPVSPAIHVEGLTGMMREVLDIAKRALTPEAPDPRLPRPGREL